MELMIFVQEWLCGSKENMSMHLRNRNSKFSIVCKHCMIWANLPLILKECLVLHGKLLYIETFLLIDHFYISLPPFPLLLLSGANTLIQDSSLGSCLLAQTNGRRRTEKFLNSFLTKILFSVTDFLKKMLSLNKFLLKKHINQLPSTLPYM